MDDAWGMDDKWGMHDEWGTADERGRDARMRDDELWPPQTTTMTAA